MARSDIEIIREADATDPAPGASFTLAAEALRVIADLDRDIAALRERRDDLAAAITRHVAIVAPEHLGILIPGKAVFVHRKRTAGKCDDVQRLVAILAARIGEKAFAEDRPPAAVASYITEEALRCAGVIPQQAKDPARPWGTFSQWRTKRVRLHWRDFRLTDWVTEGDEYVTFDVVDAVEEDTPAE